MSQRPMNSDQLDVRAIRRHFSFPKVGRIVTNNAASTQPPDELLALYASLGPGYNYVPWYAMCREILPRLGRRVDYRLARFGPATGELDLDHLASLIDARTKLVCCTGASNFLGTRNPLQALRALADDSGYSQPGGQRRSYLLVDGAQLVPGSFTDVQTLDVDFLAFSFHKMLAPFGIGVLYAKEHLLASALPFLYGG